MIECCCGCFDRLATVQEQRPPTQVSILTTQPAEEDLKNLLSNIQAIAPNHNARIHSIEVTSIAHPQGMRIYAVMVSYSNKI